MSQVLGTYRLFKFLEQYIYRNTITLILHIKKLKKLSKLTKVAQISKRASDETQVGLA